MAKITLANHGQIILPRKNGYLHPIEPGTVLVLESSERGLLLHYVRPDLQQVYLEATSFCNLTCDMCVRQVWRDPRGRMSRETFANVLDGLRSFPNLKRVTIGGFGEPLMHPDIVDMVAQIHALGISVTMMTNGLLLKPELAQTLLHAGLDKLVVSLDSMHLQAYHQAGMQEGLDRVLDNLHGLRDLIRSGGWTTPALGLEYVVTRSNEEDLHKLPGLARELGATFAIVSNLLPHTPEMAQETLYDRDELLNLGGGWGVHRAGWVRWGTVNLPRMKWGAARQCRFIKDNTLAIGWDGGVSPCLALLHTYTYYIYGRRKEVNRHVFGNINEQPLLDLWTAEDYVVFRAKVRDFRFPSCVDCGIDCSFAQENTDCWGNDPSCADCLWAQDIVRCP